MDIRFRPAFERQVDYFRQKPEYDEIYNMIKSVQTQVPLRPDAELFLMINVGQLIVIPWSETEKQDFLQVHRNILHQDLAAIIGQADKVASSSGRREISANALLEAVASRTVRILTRGLDIWGP